MLPICRVERSELPTEREILTRRKIEVLKELLKLFNQGELTSEMYHELVDLVQKARSYEELNKVFEKAQISPF